MTQSCAFCQIATGKIPAAVADEGEQWTSFPPLGPHAPGHMLFIPRRHVRDATIEPALTGTIFAGRFRLSRASPQVGRQPAHQRRVGRHTDGDASPCSRHSARDWRQRSPRLALDEAGQDQGEPMKTREPALTVGTATAVVAAVIALLVAFGLDLSTEQQTAILTAVGVIAPIVGALLTRPRVTPVGDHRADL